MSNDDNVFSLRAERDEMCKQNARLHKAANSLLELVDATSPDFRNGVTDGSGGMDEGNVWAGTIIDEMRSALRVKPMSVNNDSGALILEDGKYAIVREPLGGMRALRYGDEWRDLTGDKLVGALVDRVGELQEQLAMAMTKLEVEQDVGAPTPGMRG